MKVMMAYGRAGLELTLPEEWEVTVLRKSTMPVLADPAQAVAQALASPVGCAPLAEEARGGKSACIAVCDITRPVPNGLFLPALLERLQEAGLPKNQITILVATGLHRPNLGDELTALLGHEEILNMARVVNHDARNNDDHIKLGLTSRQTPVLIDRRFVQADLRIVTGLVEPHFMAGYSGGRKVVAPGLAHHRTIRRFHAAAFLEHPNAANCVLDGNPLHEDQMEILDMVGQILAVNTVVDERRRLSFINFGEVRQSHGQAVEFVRRHAEIHLAEQYDAVITSSAGDPLDKTYYQTVKGMVGAMRILKPGGRILIVSRCEEGLGSKEYAVAQQRLVEWGPDRFIREIKKKNLAAIDEWQTEMQCRATVSYTHLTLPTN